MKDLDLSIFIIGVPKKYRGSNLEARLKQEGFGYSRVDGTDGSLMSTVDYFSKTQQNISKRLLGRPLTKGELCCAMAHVTAYERFLDADTEWALILEDDCELTNEFEISNLLKQIRGYAPTVVQLYGVSTYLEQVKRWPWVNLVISRQITRQELLRIRRSWELPECTYGYLINRAAARVAVKKMKNSRHVTTADWPAQWRGKVNFIVSRQSFLSTKENDSLIDFDRVMERSMAMRQSKKVIPEFNTFLNRERSSIQYIDFKFTLRMFIIWGKEKSFLQKRRAIKLGWRFIAFFIKSSRLLTSLRINRN